MVAVEAGVPAGCLPIRRYENSCGGAPPGQREYSWSTLANRLFGTERLGSRVNIDPAAVSSINCAETPFMALTSISFPPEKAKTPWSGCTRLWSVGRTERRPPTLVGACDWKTAASRVMPPSTTSS